MELRPISFTVKARNRLALLTTPIKIYSTKEYNKSFKNSRDIYTALWDTGSTFTVISSKLASELGLDIVGEKSIDTAGGKYKASNYVISISLPNHLNIEDIMVYSGELGEGIDILIGMDIITLGDFSISNVDNKTVFSFRFPSSKIIDFVKEEKN